MLVVASQDLFERLVFYGAKFVFASIFDLYKILMKLTLWTFNISESLLIIRLIIHFVGCASVNEVTILHFIELIIC